MVAILAVRAFSKFPVGELKGVADTTGTPLIQTVEHPVDAVEDAAHAIAHPIQTAGVVNAHLNVSERGESP